MVVEECPERMDLWFIGFGEMVSGIVLISSSEHSDTETEDSTDRCTFRPLEKLNSVHVDCGWNNLHDSFEFCSDYYWAFCNVMHAEF